MNIADEIVYQLIEAIETDEEPYDMIGQGLVNIYEKADEKEKKVIDDVFVTLCGWKFPTLTEEARKAVSEYDEENTFSSPLL